jgi:plasmid stability protein
MIIHVSEVLRMARLTIEKFPDDLFRQLKTYAASEGKTMREIVIESVEKALPRTLTVKIREGGKS